MSDPYVCIPFLSYRKTFCNYIRFQNNKKQEKTNKHLNIHYIACCFHPGKKVYSKHTTFTNHWCLCGIYCSAGYKTKRLTECILVATVISNNAFYQSANYSCKENHGRMTKAQHIRFCYKLLCTEDTLYSNVLSNVVQGIESSLCLVHLFQGLHKLFELSTWSLSQSSDHIILHIWCALTDCPNRFTLFGHHPFSWIIHRTNNYSLFSSAPLFVHWLSHTVMAHWLNDRKIWCSWEDRHTIMCSTARINKQICSTNCTIPHCLDLHQHLYNNSI